MSIKAAVIGVGYLGRHHARIYSSLEGVELAGVVDRNPAAAAEVSAMYGCAAYSDFRDILDKAEVISIVTETIHHHAIALQCLRQGRHLLIEKPVTATVAEADELLNEAEKHGAVVAVGHLERFNPAVLRAAELIDKPYFFNAERVSPFLGRSVDVDITLDLMIHDIDIVSGFIGHSPARSISASGGCIVTKKIDMAKAWIEYACGARACLSASRINTDTRRSLDILHEGGALTIDYKDRRLYRSDAQGASLRWTSVDVAEGEPLRLEIEDFINAVRAKGAPRVSLKDGRDALRTALSITDIIRKAR